MSNVTLGELSWLFMPDGIGRCKMIVMTVLRNGSNVMWKVTNVSHRVEHRMCRKVPMKPDALVANCRLLQVWVHAYTETMKCMLTVTEKFGLQFVCRP